MNNEDNNMPYDWALETDNEDFILWEKEFENEDLG